MSKKLKKYYIWYYTWGSNKCYVVNENKSTYSIDGCELFNKNEAEHLVKVMKKINTDKLFSIKKLTDVEINDRIIKNIIK